MEIYFWLALAALLPALLALLVNARLTKAPAVGPARLATLLNVLTVLLLVAAVVAYFVSGVEVTITRT